MRDSDLVAAIVAGDSDGLATAYDKYAALLYAYCRSLLHEPDDAADAVQDTFVIAASRVGGLRDRERLRPWLYAVARNECRRRLRSRSTTSTLDEAPDVTDEMTDVSSDAERAELRALLRAAVLGLNPAEQEVIELQLRQGLDGSEVADVLGISRNHAHALISRARDQLAISLGVLLVARTGRQACAALNTLLEGWDGHLNTLMRKRLNRHVERCPVCSERRRSELRPAMLLGLAPVAAISAAAAAPAAPAGLKEEVLRLASSNVPEAVAHRASVVARASQFGEQGFPKPLDPPKHWWQTRSTQLTAGAAAAAAVIAVASVVLGTAGHPQAPQAAGQGSAPGPAPAGQSPSPSPGATSPSSARGNGGVNPGEIGRPGSTGLASPGSPLTGASSIGPGPGRSSPGSSSSSSGSSVPSTAPPTTGRSTTPHPTSPASTRVVPGTLSVSPTSVLLSTLGGTSVTLTAVGGPVSWSISESSSLIGHLNVSPMSGTLAAGQSATVTISVSSLISLDTTLTINPGGQTVTVVVGLL